MDINTFQEIINGWDIWLSVFIMILIVVLQSAFFLKTAIKEAKTIGISGEKRKAAMRAACITAIGPSMSPVIMMLAMSTVLGTPYTWFVLNNVGAARTELAAAAMGASVAGVEVMDANIGIRAWTYGIWAGVLNSAGWLIVVFLLNHKMEHMVHRMYSRFSEKWIKESFGWRRPGLICLFAEQSAGRKNNCQLLCSDYFRTLFSVIWDSAEAISEAAGIFDGDIHVAGMFLTEVLFG